MTAFLTSPVGVTWLTAVGLWGFGLVLHFCRGRDVGGTVSDLRRMSDR